MLGFGPKSGVHLNIHQPYFKTKEELQEISKLLNEEETLEKGTKAFRVFIEEILNSEFSSIRSTALAYNDLTETIIEKIKQSNFLDSDKKELLLKRISEFMGRHREQAILPNKYYLKSKFTELIEVDNFDYRSVLKIFSREKVLNDSFEILKIADKKFNPTESDSLNNTEQTLWMTYENQLKINFSYFSHLIEESDFIHTCILLSKAQKYINLENYTEGINYLNRFIESYLNGVLSKNRQNPEKDKKKPIPVRINLFGRISGNIQEITDSFKKCITAGDMEGFFDLNHHENYDSINGQRNKKQHPEDLGISQNMWEDKFIYLHQDLPNETQSNFLNYWYEKFGLPQKNIFDQVNERIIELLDNPDFEPQTTPNNEQ